MSADAQELLDIIARARTWVDEQHEKGWPPLSDRYLAWIARVEALPRNQSGVDKSDVWRSLKRDVEHFARARRLR
jgi:hypothetical protein